MRTLSYFIVFACIISTSLPLAAGVFERDLLVLGDGLLTFDDVNQREWLDLPYTLGNLADVKSQMAPGEPLHGFHFASLDEVVDLNLSAGVSETNGFSLPGVFGPEPKNLVDLLGYIVRAEGGIIPLFEYTVGQVAIGYMDDEPIFDDQNVVVFSIASRPSVTGNLNTPEIAEILFSGGFFTFPPIELLNGLILGSGDNGPFWLYRNVVPEPKSFLLLTIGTITTLLIRNRRR